MKNRLPVLLLVAGLATLSSSAWSLDRLQCSQISDAFCDTLWKKNRGNMKTIDGEILAGTTSKSEMYYVQKANFEALIAAENRLPADFRKRVRPALRELKRALGHESDTKEWYTEVSLPSYRIDLAIEETVQERVEKQWPELRKVRVRDRTFDQERRYWKENTRLKDQIVAAQYEIHPNWKRVERTFKLAQEDILQQVAELKISDSLKKKMQERVKSIHLTLPFLNPKDAMINESCQKTEINSYYFPSTHTFTVCTGMFNAFPSDSVIYVNTAHEIAHSIDPTRVATWKLMDSSEMYKRLQKLKGAKGRAFTCQEWDKLKKLITLPTKISEPPKPELAKFYNCLTPNPDAKPFNTDNVRQASSQEAVIAVDSFATPNYFTRVVQPIIEKEGKTQPNEFYMDPTLMRAFYNRGFDVINEDTGVWLLDLFAQEYACTKLKTAKGEIDYKSKDISSQKALFEQSIRTSAALNQSLLEEWYTYCGRSCPELSRYNLSKDARENFADWMAYRAFEQYLKRLPDLESRRTTSTIANAIMCEPPSPMASGPHFTAIEKTFSLEAHPDNRVRRIALYNKKVADLAQCDVDEDITRNFGSCEP